MPATTRRRQPSPTGTKIQPTPRRFLRCLACGTVKKERGYALCAECWRVNGTLPRHWFGRWAKLAEREGVQRSYRGHPRFGKAARIYASRRRRAEQRAAREAGMPRLGRRVRERADRYAGEPYDGLGAWTLEEHVAWERDGVALPEPERSMHRELTEAEIAAWDARVDRWAAARGVSLAPEPAEEIRPWGWALEVDGALVWTDDPA